VGNSGIVAQDAQHKFFRLGVNTIAYSDGHMQVMSASLLGPGDCVVVISNSGRTRDLMDACDIARRNGATTIVITATGSPLASAVTSIWQPTTRRALTATAPWCRACCT
jgi:RpiR family carbohydrate utilization transcriptional regulator